MNEQRMEVSSKVKHLVASGEGDVQTKLIFVVSVNGKKRMSMHERNTELPDDIVVPTVMHVSSIWM